MILRPPKIGQLSLNKLQNLVISFRAQLIKECIQGTSFSVLNANANDLTWPQSYDSDKVVVIWG